jgi:myo-inositol-1(or 4)-monophosphatase
MELITHDAGAVADVVGNQVFSAAVGMGARWDGQPITASACNDIGRAMVTTGFSYSAELRRQQGELVGRLIPIARDIRCFGSAAIQLCWVACGRVDAYYERDTKVWDYAAGALIAAEAGATVELPCPENDSLCVAAPPELFAELRGLIEYPA